MRAWKICMMLLLCLALLALPICASDENFGEADEFETTEQENVGEIEEFDTTAETDAESRTTEESQSTEESLTTAPTTEDRESESDTQKGGTVYPPAREPLWALPIPVIWGTIALVGIAGVTLAVLFLIKYFKQEQ